MYLGIEGVYISVRLGPVPFCDKGMHLQLFIEGQTLLTG